MKKQITNKILRLKLTDFLGREVEEYVILALASLSQDLSIALTVSMWYSERDLDTKMLDRFKSENRKLVDVLGIQFFHLNGYEYHTWYDIIGKNDESRLHKYYFRLVYNDPIELPTKLIEFRNFAKHYGQKNEKHSYDGLPKLARPS